jgi:hypothetical protein
MNPSLADCLQLSDVFASLHAKLLKFGSFGNGQKGPGVVRALANAAIRNPIPIKIPMITAPQKIRPTHLPSDSLLLFFVFSPCPGSFGTSTGTFGDAINFLFFFLPGKECLAQIENIFFFSADKLVLLCFL